MVRPNALSHFPTNCSHVHVWPYVHMKTFAHSLYNACCGLGSTLDTSSGSVRLIASLSLPSICKVNNHCHDRRQESHAHDQPQYYDRCVAHSLSFHV